MRTAKFVLITLVFASIVASAFASGTSEKSASSSQVQKPIVLRYAHVGMKGELQTRYAADFAKKVAEETNGRVKIQVFPNSELGGVTEIIAGVKNGSIAMAQHDYASLATYVPGLAAMDAPYVFSSAAQALRATSPYTSPAVEKLNKELIAKAGIRIIGSFYRGARELTANIPIYKPSDLIGKKIRGVSLPLWMSMLKGMDATPVPIAVAELQTALMTGVVIGQENPLNMIQSAKLYEVQKYVMMTNHMYSVLVVFMNEGVWEKIPHKDQQIIENVAKEMSQVSLQWVQSSDAQITAKLKSEGMTFITPKDGLDVAAFKASVQKQIHHDFPAWGPILAQLEAVK